MEKSKEPDPETLEIIFGIAKDEVARQFTEVHSMDDKLSKLLEAGAIVAGVAGLSGILASPVPMVLWFGLGALLAFGGVVTAVAFGMQTRQWDPGFNPGEIWNQQWQQTPGGVRHAMIDRAAKAHESNRKLLASKAVCIRWAVLLLALEAGFVALSLISSRLA